MTKLERTAPRRRHYAHRSARRRQRVRGASVPCVDLTDRFRHSVRQGGLAYQPNDTHWSPEGHAIAAAALEEVLRERGC